MILRFLFYLASVICSLLALYATGRAVTKDVDIVVVHDGGPLLTTYTVFNNSATPA